MFKCKCNFRYANSFMFLENIFHEKINGIVTYCHDLLRHLPLNATNSDYPEKCNVHLSVTFLFFYRGLSLRLADMVDKLVLSK